MMRRGFAVGVAAAVFAFVAGPAEARTFDDLTTQTWDAAAPMIPAVDGPLVIEAATPGHWGSYSADGAVRIPAAMTKALLDPANPGHDFAFANLLHELAHSQQDPELNSRAAEGAADLWSRWAAPQVAKALGIPYHKARYGYPARAAWVRAHYPAAWWQGGIDPASSQFH